MKKFCVVLTALALMCALCACGGQSAPVNEPNDPPAQTNSQPKTDDQQAPDNSKENDAKSVAAGQIGILIFGGSCCGILGTSHQIGFFLGHKL